MNRRPPAVRSRLPGVRFAVQQLLVRAAVDDGSAKAAQRVGQEFPICVDELRTLRTVSDDRLRFFDSIREVWCGRIELPHACMEAFKRLRVLGRRGVGRRQGLVVRPVCDHEAVTDMNARLHSRLEQGDRAVGPLKLSCHLDFERRAFTVPLNRRRDASKHTTRQEPHCEPVRVLDDAGVFDA
jgi:hypothetical protein